jgi:hypothetical protein
MAMLSLPRHAKPTTHQLEPWRSITAAVCRASLRRGAIVTGHSPTSLARSPLRAPTPRCWLLRAVPSSWTAISNLPSPSTPIPISRPMRRPGRRARCGDRSVSNPSRALLLRGHYLLLCRASSLLGEGEIAVAVAEGLGADVKWPGGCLGSLEAIK